MKYGSRLRTTEPRPNLNGSYEKAEVYHGEYVKNIFDNFSTCKAKYLKTRDF